MVAGVTLQVDGLRWREHLAAVAAATHGLVPVIKGNGYGFGLELLAAEASRLGVDTVAVGTPAEVAAVRAAYGGDIVICILADPGPAGRCPGRRSVGDHHGVPAGRPQTAGGRRPAERPGAGRGADLDAPARDHGRCLDRVGPLLSGLRFEGWTIHLPLPADGRYAEAELLSRVALAVRPGPLWLSHLPSEKTAALARQLGGASGDPAPVRLRLGTRIWLGAKTPGGLWRPCSTYIRYAGANGPATGSGWCPPTAGSW